MLKYEEMSFYEEYNSPLDIVAYENRIVAFANVVVCVGRLEIRPGQKISMVFISIGEDGKANSDSAVYLG